jgi:hypothetical protein
MPVLRQEQQAGCYTNYTLNFELTIITCYALLVHTSCTRASSKPSHFNIPALQKLLHSHTLAHCVQPEVSA